MGAVWIELCCMFAIVNIDLLFIIYCILWEYRFGEIYIKIRYLSLKISMKFRLYESSDVFVDAEV